MDRIPFGRPLLTGPAGNIGRVVGRVIQDLNFQLIKRIINQTGGLYDALGNRVFVEHGKLDGDAGQLVKFPHRLVYVVTVLEVEVEKNIAVEPIYGYRTEKGHICPSQQVSTWVMPQVIPHKYVFFRSTNLESA